MKILKPNKYEFYLSLALVPLTGLSLGLPLGGRTHISVIVGGTLAALLWALNAALDAPRMNRLEHALAMAWLVSLSLVTCFVLFAIYVEWTVPSVTYY